MQGLLVICEKAFRVPKWDLYETPVTILAENIHAKDLHPENGGMVGLLVSRCRECV